jgi:hypothetical protein
MVQRPRALGFTDRQRNGGAEDVVGIVISLCSDEPLDIAAVAFRHTVRVLVRRQQVRISARKRHRIERLQSGPGPQAMPLLLDLVRSIDSSADALKIASIMIISLIAFSSLPVPRYRELRMR